MNQTTQHHRTQLNNWLQVNGGPERLDWESFRVGPQNDPTWTAICLIDGVEWSRAEASTLAAAKEEAARKVLRTFSFKNMASTGRFASG
ncbi:hypothetical protein BDM02DRAFT_3265950 [Thelephora ganbajun]|uniref:Uncharacterized protein n=1 Tax=Thelephora ganbajun TaxID=370292 RepID=A0ACB6ZTR5_THEGA|nr:hypothetical protein BDM02DRAFT_3265950 [Thelephora ganbajun]